MSYVTASSSFTPYLSYDFTGKVASDMSARHAFIQAQAPLTPLTSTTETRFVDDGQGNAVPVPLFFETNDGLQTTADGTNVIEIFGDNSNSAAPFTQRRSGLLTTVDTANRVTVQNQRDITSYVVGDPTIYNTQFATIQQAVDQAVADGVDVSANPRREAQIIIKPGTYAGNVIIPRHGISLIALSSGSTKDVTISGTLFIQTTDSSAKTLILVRGLHFAGGTPNIVAEAIVNFNPKVLIDDCVVEGPIHLLGTQDNVECSIKDSIVNVVWCESVSNNVSLSLINTQAEDTVFLHSLNGSLTLFNGSRCGTSSFDPLGNPPLINNLTTVTVNNSSIFLQLNNAPATDHSGQFLNIRCANSTINGMTLFGNIDNLQISNCSINGDIRLGDPSSVNGDNLFTYVSFQNCTFENTSGTIISLKNTTPNIPQQMLFNHCTFEALPFLIIPKLQILDVSTNNVPSSVTSLNMNLCKFLTPIEITGPNVSVTFTHCNHDISLSNVNVDGLGNFAAIYGGSAIAPSTVICFWNSYTLKNTTANDFVIYGNNFINWTYRNALPGGFPVNTILNSGATAANLSGNFVPGNVVVVDSGYSMV
jgi:hypothetical protein